MSTTVTATFTIRETTYYTGHVTIDPDKWAEVMPAPFDPKTATPTDVADYVFAAEADVTERNANIDGQEWSDLEFEEDSE